MYKFSDKMSNGNVLQGVTCWADSLELLQSKNIFTTTILGDHLILPALHVI